MSCTNHFEAPGLAGRRPPRKFQTTERLNTLRRVSGQGQPFDVGDVHAALSLVHQGDLTMQTMVFEPAALRFHVGFGRPPSTEAPLIPIDLGALFE